MNWYDSFNARIPHIYFIYGLAFFAFRLAHGSHDRIVETHEEERTRIRLSLIGGDVQIRSALGQGTTLRVRVPVR
jgi:hypothetical protein